MHCPCESGEIPVPAAGYVRGLKPGGQPVCRARSSLGTGARLMAENVVLLHLYNSK